MRIKLIGLTVFAIVISSIVKGQSYTDIGVFVGGSFYTGEINPNKVFPKSHTHPSIGVNYRYNLNRRWSYRANLIYGQLSGNDADTDLSFNQNRNLSFHTNLWELSGQVEFNFFSFDPNNNQFYKTNIKRATPYLFVGLGAFYYNPKTMLDGNEFELRPLETEGVSYSSMSISMPIGFGVKAKVTQRLILSAEWGIRFTFTDYIDDVSSVYPVSTNGMSEIAQILSDRSLDNQGPNGTNNGTKRGNSYNNDAYHFVGIGIHFNLTKPSNGCHFGQGRTNKNVKKK